MVEGCEHVFNLAADMGGMGFIQSNHSVIMYNNTMIRHARVVFLFVLGTVLGSTMVLLFLCARIS